MIRKILFLLLLSGLAPLSFQLNSKARADELNGEKLEWFARLRIKNVNKMNETINSILPNEKSESSKIGFEEMSKQMKAFLPGLSPSEDLIMLVLADNVTTWDKPEKPYYPKLGFVTSNVSIFDKDIPTHSVILSPLSNAKEAQLLQESLKVYGLFLRTKNKWAIISDSKAVEQVVNDLDIYIDGDTPYRKELTPGFTGKINFEPFAKYFRRKDETFVVENLRNKVSPPYLEPVARLLKKVIESLSELDLGLTVDPQKMNTSLKLLVERKSPLHEFITDEGKSPLPIQIGVKDHVIFRFGYSISPSDVRELRDWTLSTLFPAQSSGGLIETKYVEERQTLRQSIERIVDIVLEALGKTMSVTVFQDKGGSTGLIAVREGIQPVSGKTLLGKEKVAEFLGGPKFLEFIKEHIGDFGIELKEMEKESSAELYQIELSILPSRLVKDENAQQLTVSGYFAYSEGLEIITLGTHSRDAMLEVINQLKRPVLSRGFGGINVLQGMVPRLAVQVDVPGMMNALIESLDGYEFEFLDSAKKSLQRFGENKVGEVTSTLTFAENGVEIAIDADLCLLRMVPVEE